MLKAAERQKAAERHGPEQTRVAQNTELGCTDMLQGIPYCRDAGVVQGDNMPGQSNQ